MHPTSVLATISGRDRPGITASFFAALAAHDVDVHDVEQVVIRDRLMLAVLFDLHGDSAALRNSVTKAAAALGMDSEVVIADGKREARTDGRSQHHVIIVGRPLRPGALSHVAQRLADIGANIDSVTRLLSESASSLELAVRAPSAAPLRAVLARAADDTGLDIAIEPAGWRRRPKRVVVLDAESTLLLDNPLALLADRAGVAAEFAAVEARRRAGELDFAESLRARVSLLAGLTEQDLGAVRDRLRLTPGAATSVRTLRRTGYHVGCVSSGLSFVTDRLVDELGLEFAAANQLEIHDGVVTGRIVEPLVDGRGKAAALQDFAARLGVPLSQTVAVGDGVGDVELLNAAGLGVAFNAQPGHRAAGAPAIELPHLDTVLFVLGISDDDLRAAAESES